jgi:signal transduction histidine kinase
VRSQITRAILAVAVLLVIGLGLPLAVVVQRFYQDGAVADLQRRAAETIVEIALPLEPNGLARVAGEADSPGEFTVYDAQGDRIFGPGPRLADAPVQEAIDGQASSVSTDRQLVLASPITDRSSETVVGAVRVTQARGVVDREVRRAWFVMAGAVLVALAGAAALARRQARQLAAPVGRLAEQAVDLGRGDFTARIDASGIAEVDTVAAALNDTAGRLAELMARERAFSADVSHQLRTPLTGLRLRLERAIGSDHPHDHLDGALEEISRLEATVEHLLALSRDRHPVGAPLAVEELLVAVAERWQERFVTVGRELRIEQGDRTVPVRGSDLSISQVLDVLIDNSLRHGGGRVTVRSRAAVGGLVLEVEDEGPGIVEDRRSAVFDRHEGDGHGIGLSLARSIAEAEGGRLLLASGQPPCFQVILPAAD